MTFGEVLNYFKKQESPDSIAPMIDDAELRNGVVAWKSVVIQYTNAEECDDSLSDAEKWNWLWQKTDFDVQYFGRVAGCPPQNARSLFERLKGLRLIYPDGTVNQFATQYLQAQIMNKLPKDKNKGKK